jgi:hypothetical protein
VYKNDGGAAGSNVWSKACLHVSFVFLSVLVRSKREKEKKRKGKNERTNITARKRKRTGEGECNVRCVSFLCTLKSTVRKNVIETKKTNRYHSQSASKKKRKYHVTGLKPVIDLENDYKNTHSQVCWMGFFTTK